MGGRGASFNIPVARSGGSRTTVGLPGTGLSWSVENTPDWSVAIPAGAAQGLSNSRRLRSGQLEILKAELLALLHQKLFASGSIGQQLWELGLDSPLLADGSLGARPTPSAASSAAARPFRRLHTWPLDGVGSRDIAATAARRAGSPYPAAPARTPQQAKDGAEKKEIPPHA